jgi:hypothetical protein
MRSMKRRATSGRPSVTAVDVEFTVAAGQGLADTARHVIGCHVEKKLRLKLRVDDAAGNGPGRYCSPCHGVPLKKRGLKMRWTTRRAICAGP